MRLDHVQNDLSMIFEAVRGMSECGRGMCPAIQAVRQVIKQRSGNQHV